MKLTKKQLILNAVFCLALLGVIIWALYAEYDRPWKRYQEEFNKLVPDIAAAAGTPQIRQIWLPELEKIDRCTTCHLGADRPGFEDHPLPYRTHTGDYLKQHPVEKFGCVVCHEGQGPALTVKAAHGETENWPESLLTGVYAQASCIKCHPVSKAVPEAAGFARAPAFMKGRKLFLKYNCTGCHKLKGYERADRIAPALTSIGSKVSREWLTRWLKDPLSGQPGTTMPSFRLSDKEIGYVADYLINLDTSDKGTLQRAPTGKVSIEAGETMYTSLGCAGCHMINGKGNDFAPDLSNIGNKTRPGWIINYLKNPQSHDRNSAMPKITAADNEIQALASYLMSLKTPPFNSLLTKGGLRGLTSSIAGREADRPTPESIAAGKRIVKDYGCTGCHEIGTLASRRVGPELDNIGAKRTDELLFPDIPSYEQTLTSWLKLKVKEPSKFNTDRIITKMPDHPFSSEETEALSAFLAGIKNDTVPAGYTRTLLNTEQNGTKGRKLIEKYNCLGCHKINNTGGDIAPDLTGEATKSRPEWLFDFLRKPYKIRPVHIMKTGMPDFSLTRSEINSIIEYLAFIAGEPYPYNKFMKKEIPPEDMLDGEKLYREIFACSACHTIGEYGGEIGPEHTDLASRLKRPWIEKWLRDPQSIKPDVRMPKFRFEGWEFEALTNYIMTLGQYRFVTVKKNN